MKHVSIILLGYAILTTGTLIGRSYAEPTTPPQKIAVVCKFDLPKLDIEVLK